MRRFLLGLLVIALLGAAVLVFRPWKHFIESPKDLDGGPKMSTQKSVLGTWEYRIKPSDALMQAMIRERGNVPGGATIERSGAVRYLGEQTSGRYQKIEVLSISYNDPKRVLKIETRESGKWEIDENNLRETAEDVVVVPGNEMARKLSKKGELRTPDGGLPKRVFEIIEVNSSEIVLHTFEDVGDQTFRETLTLKESRSASGRPKFDFNNWKSSRRK